MNENVKRFYNEHRQIIDGTKQKTSGMYIGRPYDVNCKENRNILLTMAPSNDFNDTITIKLNEQYKRRTPIKDSDGTIIGHHEVGDYKSKKILRKYPSKFTPNIVAAWKACYDYPTVSYGLANWRREVIIIDSDDYYENIEEAEKKINLVSQKFMLPQYSYILRNPSSGHIQAGWWLKEQYCSYNFETFNKIITNMSIAYKKITGNDGDICFNGPACKNPFYEGFESKINYGFVDGQPFERLSKFMIEYAEKLVYNKSSLSSSYNNTVVTVSVKDEIKSATSKRGHRNHKFGDNTSRDYLECKWLREWVWSEMRNEHTPTYKEARNKMNEFAKAAAAQTNKPLHSSTELNSKTNCTLNWAIRKFKKIEKTEKTEFRGAAFGRFIQKLQSYVLATKIMKYKDLHNDASTRTIATLFGCSNATVSRAKGIIEDYNSVVDIESFNEWFEKKEGIEAYKDLYELLKESLNYIKLFVYNISFSLSSYNNTVVTLTNDDIKSSSERSETLNYLNSLDKQYSEITWFDLNSNPHLYNEWQNIFGQVSREDFKQLKLHNYDYFNDRRFA